MDGAIVLAVRGEVDLASKRVMHVALEKALEDAQHAVIVDLSEASFMDSTGLALMVNTARRLTRRKKGFAVACPDGPVRRAFDIAGLASCIKITAGVDDALAGTQPAFSG